MSYEITEQKRKLLSEIEEDQVDIKETNIKKEELKGAQKKLDVAEPKGKLTASDFKALRAKKGIEESDHEVGMAMSSLEVIIKSATELIHKIGHEEKNIPGWIQDHITNSENYINQANKGYHEFEPSELREGNHKLLQNAIRDLKNALKNAEMNSDKIDVKSLIQVVKKSLTQIEANL
jgi:hypothetical protein